MNRGRDRHDIFHGIEFYNAFLRCLSEAHERFGVEIHAYCLMRNHYHIFARTPYANLDRIMRHINGTYTQRYNKITNKDGPLMRGRYRSLIVDTESYWLELSRYIHRNPIETDPPVVDQLENYIWSSYPAYLSLAEPPGWLFLDETLQFFNSGTRIAEYQRYVSRGNRHEFIELIRNKNTPPIIGKEPFVEGLRHKFGGQIESNLDEVVNYEKVPSNRLKIEDIVEHVACNFGIDCRAIVEPKRGRQKRNFARPIAMYLCQRVGGFTLKEIAFAFNLGHYASSASTISKFRLEMSDDHELQKLTAALANDLNAKT